MIPVTAGRWEYYVLLKDDTLRAFWSEHLTTYRRSLLYIVGLGFDPRMLMGLRLVLDAGAAAAPDVLGLRFNEGPVSPSLNHQDRVAKNWSTLESLVGSRGSIVVRTLEFWSPEGRRTSSQSARDTFTSIDVFATYTDVIVDISSMPRSVYFPLIARILYLFDRHAAEGAKRINLHVMVAEDPRLDTEIREEGIDEKAEFMASFVGGFDEEGISTPKVWIPILGEQRTTQFDRILDRVKPDEICPVLPSPARNPRRADDIMIEYQQILFDEQRLDPRNFLYASEQNPFEVYRQLRAAVQHYENVFQLLGGCRVAISPLSSKLMSLGALLVAYELKERSPGVGIAHIESQGYAIEGEHPDAELFGLWLAGDCDVS